MALAKPSAITNSIMANLYDILTNGDDTVPASEDNFFSWCLGIPFAEEDFEFLSQGLTGVVKKSALDEIRTTTDGSSAEQTTDGSNPSTGSQLELTPELLAQLRAQDTARLYMQAENFARLVDFVPDLASLNNEQFARLSVMNNEGTLSERYEYILRMSQVMHTELPEATKQKIEKFRGLLSVKKKKKNLIDDTEIEVTEPSPLVQVYHEKLAAYEAAALEYNARRIKALAANYPEDVHYWAINANLLRNRVRGAMADWVSNGYKNDYEAIAAFIDQVMQRDMALLKEEYRDDLAKTKLTGLASGSNFYYTSVVPGNFVKAAGWTEFGFSSAEFNQYKNSSYSHSRSSSRAAGGFFGLCGGSGRASSARTEYDSQVSFDTEHFRLSFKIAQIPIVRPWYRTAFLASKSWRFDQSNPEAKTEVVSDGGNPPKGLIPAYPTTMICIKDLKLSIGKSSGFSEFMSEYERSSAKGGGFLSLGNLYLGGSHSSASVSAETTARYRYKWDGQTMTVPGLQVIGFKCHVLTKKSPDPLPNISNWI